MAQFSYKARSHSGQLLEGRLEAVSAAGAADQLLANGATPVAINELKAGVSPFEQVVARLASARQGRVDIDDLILFCRQMYTLIKSGVPMLRALRGLSEMIRKPAMATTLQAVAEDLESGRDLSGSLRRHPKVFPPLLSSMVQVGEGSGQLEESFLQISRYLIREKETADQIRSAMRYPTFVVVAISIAMAVITLFVIPAFEKLYQGAGAALPLPTRIILGVSNFAVSWWWAMVLAGVAALFAWRAYLGTENGRLVWDRFKLRLPVIGSILHRATLIRFCRGFAMGYGAGVPLIQSLAFTAQAVGNAFVEKRLGRLRHSVERGDTLTRSAATSEMFTPLVLQMLAVGEETGSVDTMLVEVAEFYEREVEYDVSRLASSIEPLLIVLIGAMVLVLALGVFLPMWNMATVMRGG
ncbi:MSHA biogenesis protein MshG [Syntrophotalea acetylenivorans]|uniref:MSHA biogenesis protein MshG n=1 Tax=Syntrophotalea acetylenivorans TaxID=1842532 RepID=A0A1L3GQC5_9BACT|nr:type II secretion system F family protein [Syntrophotalea acetylenivorans]APG27868.1 MSHA biogenesis protein MshG [Syntrophotalea acetylenivorans]